MMRHLLIVLFFIFSIRAAAQDKDSLFAVRTGGTWTIKYTVKPGETPQMLAIRFYISDGVLAFANGADVINKITPGTTINIPVTKENFSLNKLPLDGLHELYCHVAPKDDISMISTYTGMSREQVRKWNNLKGNTLTPGEVLLIGWVKMMDRDSGDPSAELAYPSLKKPLLADTTRGGMDTVYEAQTNHGLNVLTEKGTAVFFEKAGKNNVFVAFHNTTRRGTVIKVFNPGTGRTIYVKVLGPLPDTKQYANCIIGISDAAREALGVTESKAWCELSYPAN